MTKINPPQPSFTDSMIPPSPTVTVVASPTPSVTAIPLKLTAAETEVVTLSSISNIHAKEETAKKEIEEETKEASTKEEEAKNDEKQQQLDFQLVDLSSDESQNGAGFKPFERKPLDVTLSFDDAKRILGEYGDDWNRFASVLLKNYKVRINLSVYFN